MSRRQKKTKSDNPMPATGAGLIRFYSEADSPGIKVGPIAVVVFTVGLIVAVLVATVLFK